MTKLENLKCLDIIIWKPRRSHSYNREKPLPVLGITNKDRCSKKYYVMGEVDTKKINLQHIIKKYNDTLCFIVETRKGYHFYFDISHPNPLRIIHTMYKMKIFDKGFLKLGKWRYKIHKEKRHAYFVLRVSPKYGEPDLKIIYINKKCLENKWFKAVYDTILFFNPNANR